MKKSSISIILLVLIMINLCLISCERNEVAHYIPIKIDDSCDTTNVSYSQFVKINVETYCEGFHDNGFSAAGVNLEYYENLKSIAINGKLKKSLIGSLRSYINDEIYLIIKNKLFIFLLGP